MQSQTHRFHSREALVCPPPILDPREYIHSPAHYAVACKDYAGLHRIISSLPKPAAAPWVRTESDAIAEEIKAEALSAVIDRRDVPLRETPLHLAVRLGDITATKILMSSGADCSLQNEQGWSALQDAICARKDNLAKIIIKYYQPLAWAKWCRRLPRIIASMQRMRNFYMEVSFNFESSVIPLIARAAPSDTYRIWKLGSNLRADMTLSGFDGFKIQRSGQTFLFLGEGSDDGTLPAGSLCVLDHKTKEVTNALEGADKELTDHEIAQEVTLMGKTNLYRPGIDVTQAILVPQLSWMWQEKVETVHGWKAKVYDMHNVTVSVKSREVLGAMTDEEFFQKLPNLDSDEDYIEMLTEDDKKHMDKASTSRNIRDDEDTRKHKAKAPVTNIKDGAVQTSTATSSAPSERKGSLKQSRKGLNEEGIPRSSLSSDKKEVDLFGDGEDEHSTKSLRLQRGRRSKDGQPSSYRDAEETFVFVNERRGKTREPAMRKSRVKLSTHSSKESEFKKNLKPALWLTPDFPLKTEELVPLLDILASKVKAIRRLRELLTTKLPPGTFPVKIALPVVPTIRVIITFSKFEELQSEEEEFVTPPSSPNKRNQHKEQQYPSSWLSWIKGASMKVVGSHTKEQLQEERDLFAIPHDYKWTSRTPKKQKKGATKS